jgi:hypothetical protein
MTDATPDQATEVTDSLLTAGLLDQAEDMTGATFAQTGLTEAEETDSNEPVDATNPADIIPTDAANDGWFWKDELKGEGDKPVWLGEKFKSVQDQAKAYPELEKKFGGFKGAPDEYEIAIPDELSSTVDIDVDSEPFKQFEEFAKESNMSQELFEKCTNFHLEAINEALNPSLSEEDIAEHTRSEIEKLGNNGPQVIEHLKKWGQNNLNDEEFEAFKRFGDSAENIRVLRSIINKSQATAIAPDVTSRPSYTDKELSAALLSEDYRRDRAFRKQIDAAYMQKLNNRG